MLTCTPSPAKRRAALIAAAALLLTLPGSAARADEAGKPSTGGAKEPAEATAPDLLLVSCAALHLGEGTVHRPGLLLIEDGKVKAAGSDLEVPEEARRWDFPLAEITPGLVEPSATVSLGASEARGARGNAVLSTADARDPWDPWLREVRSEGVVAAALHPLGDGTYRGRIATIGTTGPAAGGAPVLSEAAALAVSFESGGPGSAARASFRSVLEGDLEESGEYAQKWKEWKAQDEKDEKKSPSELRREERRRKEKKDRSKRVKKPGLDESREVLVQVLDRKLPLRIRADRRESVEAALDLARSRGLPLTISGCLECAPLAVELAESRAIVLLSPLEADVLEGEGGTPDPGLVAALSAAGARLAVTGGGAWPVGPSWLRLAAADLVRQGASTEQAVSAMTGEAAVAAGLGETHGRLVKDREAEFVVWSGDPLSPSSRMERLVTPAETRRGDEGAEAGTVGQAEVKS